MDVKNISNISLAATSVRIICKESSSGEFHPSINFQTRTLGSFDSFGVSWWPFLFKSVWRCWRNSTVWEKFGTTIIAKHEIGLEKYLFQNCESHIKSSIYINTFLYRSNCKSFSNLESPLKEAKFFADSTSLQLCGKCRGPFKNSKTFWLKTVSLQKKINYSVPGWLLKPIRKRH